MHNYAKTIAFIFDLCGNEFTSQILLVTLLFLFVAPKRSLFFVRYPFCFATIIGLQTLCRFGYIYIPPPVNYGLVFAMIVATIAFCYKTNFNQAVFIGVCIYCGQFILSNISFMLIFTVIHITQNPQNYIYYFVVMPIVTALSLVGIYFLIVRAIKKQNELRFNNVVILYSVITFVMVATTLTHYARFEIFWSFLGQIYLLSIATLFTNTTLAVGFMNLKKRQLEEENRILHQLLHKDKLRYEQAKLSNEKIQIKYHDMKQRENQGIIDYESLSEIESDSEILKSTYFTGNVALDVILSEKALMCERLGIRLICVADGALLDFMKPYHIYSLIGNALENAIESLKSERESEVKEINISITRFEKMCVIKTVNFTSKNIVIRDGLPVTGNSDSENHGFGTKSMRNVVNSYGGQLRFFEQENMFTMVAMLPIPQTQQGTATIKV